MTRWKSPRSSGTVRVTVVAALLLALPVLSVHRSAAVETTTASTLTLVGESGDQVVGTKPYVFRAGPDQVAAQRYGNSAVNVYVTRGSTSYTFSFNEPVSRSFGTGTFVSDQGSASTGYPHVDVVGLHGCTTRHSKFTVVDMAADLSRLQIEYELGCATPDTAFGELSYNEPADADVVVAPTRVTWPDRAIGAAAVSAPITLINTGTDALTLTDAAVTGDEQYRTDDPGQCAAIAAGQSCALDVHYAPTKIGDSAATLVLTDSSARGSHAVPLSGTAYDPNAPAPAPAPSPTTPPARPCTNTTPDPFAPTPPPPPPPTPGIASTVTLVGDAGNFVTQGQACAWRAGPDRIVLNDSDPGTVELDVGVGTIQRRDDFAFQFRLPVGQPLTPGTYFVDSGAGAGSANLTPGINVFGDGRACTSGSGDKFTVLDAAADHSRLWIQYQTHCGVTGATGPTASGEVRYNEPADNDLVLAPERIDRSAQAVGATARRVPVTLFNTGERALTISAVTVDGPAALDFLTDGFGNCATIAAGASCAVDVGFSPTAPGQRDAALHIFDSSAEREHTVPLSGRATTIASTVTLTGDPGDPVSTGGSALWRGGPDRVTVSGSTSSIKVEAARLASVSPDLTLTFATPVGQTMTAGTTYPLAREPGDGPGQSPAISAATPDTTCNSDTGQFTVVDVADDLSRLWLLYEAHCDGAGAAAFGEIRYNEPIDADMMVAPSRVAWPLGKIGTPERSVPVTVFNTGAAPLTLSGTDLSAGTAVDFATTGQCAQIAAGDSCVLTAGFTPGGSGPRGALLKLSDSSAEGFHTVALAGLGAFDGPPATVTMSGEPGQTISYQNPTLLWRDGPDRITVAGGGSGGVSVSADHGVTGSLTPIGLSFASGDGSPLTVGRTYAGATGNGSSANGYVAGTPMINATVNHQTCPRFAGQFTVHDIAADLSRVWITYEVRCNGSSGAIFGEIRYNEPVDADLALAPARITLPDSGAVGVSVPVTVVNTGSAPLRLTGTSFRGPAAADFLAHAGCPDPVPAGGSCVVTVTYRPSHAGAEQADLTIGDSSAEGAHRVAFGAAVAMPSSVTLVGEHDDQVVGNSEELFVAGRDVIESHIDYTGVHVVLSRADRAPDSYTMDFQPAPGERLTVGQYVGAQTYTATARDNPGIYVNQYPAPHQINGAERCPVDTGRFTVLDIAPDLGRVWLVYQSHCDGGTVFGEVRINESTDPDVSVTPRRIEFPDSARSVTVSVLNNGPTPLAVKSATLSGPAAADFVATGVAACASIPVGGGCSLQVSFRPTTNGDRTATLTLTDSSSAGSHTVDLAGTASGITPATTAQPPPPAKPAAPKVVTSRLSAKADATKIRHGHSTKIRATVSPATAHRTVVLQQLSGGHWKTVARGTTDSHGHATFSVKPKKKGKYSYRAHCARDTAHTSATSKTVKLSAS